MKRLYFFNGFQSGEANFEGSKLRFQSSGSFTLTASVAGTAVTCQSTEMNVRGSFPTQPSVVPQDMQAGAETAVIIQFTTFNALPASGKVIVEFPSSGFSSVSGTPTVSDCKVDGVAVAGTPTATSAGLVVTVTIGSAVTAGSSVSFLVGNVKNRGSEGATGVFPVFKTTLSDGTTSVDEASAAFNAAGRPVSVALTAHEFFESPVVALRSDVALAVGDTTISFGTENPLPVSSTIVVTFPASFTINSPLAVTGFSIGDDASSIPTTTVTGNTVTLKLNAAAPKRSSVTFKIGTTNPATAGQSGAFVRIGTTLADGTTRVDECSSPPDKLILQGR